MKIIAVDDDPFILQVLRLSLAAGGYPGLVCARDAAAAADEIARAQAPFDCVLLDIQMPGKDGIQLCRELRARPEYVEAPIIMLTAMSDRSYVERAFDAGATDYLSKPFETVELQSRIRAAERLVNSARARDLAERKLASVVATVDFQAAVDFEDSVDISDLPNFLDFARFHNFLRQTVRARHAPEALFSAKVPQAAQMYSRLPARDYVNFLSDLGDAISDAVADLAEVFTYAGSGHFLLAAATPDASASERMRRAMQAEIDRLGIRFPDGRIMPAAVVVGAPQPLEGVHEEHVGDAMAEAIRSAELAAARVMAIDIAESGGKAERLSLRLS